MRAFAIRPIVFVRVALEQLRVEEILDNRDLGDTKLPRRPIGSGSKSYRLVQ